MDPAGSLPHSQQPATCPYPEPDQSNPCLPSNFLKIHFTIILQFMSRSSTWSLSLSFSHPSSVCTSPLPMRTTRPAHIILLDLITLIIFGEQYRPLSSSSGSFLHSPVTSSLLGPNISLSAQFSKTLSLCFLQKQM